MRTFPALEIAWPAAPSTDVVEQLLAAIDDASPTAVEDHGLGVRVFFATESDRDAAADILFGDAPDATLTSLMVPDENWAERSQAALQPVRVGRVIVAPPWTLDGLSPGEGDIVISIQPSMGFGTGHHPTTRLCLGLLQRHPTSGAALDIGTGSGVLAIAAWKLGAKTALGVDFDRDALNSASENIDRNHAADAVTLDVVDIASEQPSLRESFDVVFANITGAMLQRHAANIVATMKDGAVLIASGFQLHERDDVARAFRETGLEPLAQADEESWVAVSFRRSQLA